MIFKRPDIYVHIFHKWGLPDFVDDGFKYEVWEGCAIFAHRYHLASDSEEVHMAIDPKFRHKCRDAVKYMQGKHSRIIAICHERNIRINNLLIKCGFFEKGVVEEELKTGLTERMRVMLWEA